MALQRGTARSSEPVQILAGITLTPSMSLRAHMDEKLKVAKFAIGSVWSRLLNKNKIPFEAKMDIFQAAMKTVMTYGAQAWGYQQFEQVEKLLKYFVKRTMKIPMNTPDYFVYRQLGLNKISVHTFELGLRHLKKVAKMRPDRLPNIVAREVCRTGGGWVRAWSGLLG